MAMHQSTAIIVIDPYDIMTTEADLGIQTQRLCNEQKHDN
jgi:hypothetical protein